MAEQSGIYTSGSVILKAQPYAHILCESQRGTRCDWCFKTPPRLLRCSRCTLMQYCNVSCQKNDWNLHKEECKHLKRLAPRVPSDSMRLFHRLLLRHQRGDHLKEKAEFGGITRTFQDLMSHMEDIKADRSRMEGFLTVCTALQAFTSDNFPFPPAQTALDVFGKMVINSFSICDGEMNPVGVGLYLGPSILDHSCQPNAVCVFEGTELLVHCISPTPIKLEELRVSYIELLASTSERHQELQQQYYFACSCPLCSDTHRIKENIKLRVIGLCGGNSPVTVEFPAQRDELLSSAVCPECKGAIPQTQEGSLLACCECEFSPPDDDLASKANTVATQAKQAQQKMKSLMKNKDYEALLSQAEQQLSRMEGVLHNLNAACVRCRDAALDATIGLQQMEKAVQYATQNMAAYRQYYPSVHPSLGLHLLKLAKIQIYLDRHTEARTHLQQAEAILSLTHGQGHSLMTTLRQLQADIGPLAEDG